MIDFNKIVKNLFKKSGNILFKEDIFEIIDPEKKDKYQGKLDKTIYNLKAQNYIIPIKSWVYIIPDENDKNLNKIDLIEKYYLKLLKKYITKEIGSEYYISWKKALEINLKNYSIPDKIYIINRKINKKILVWNYQIIFKTIYWNEDWKKINLFSKFKNHTDIKNIDSIDFKVSNIELSLVESCILNDINENLDINLITKTLKKYSPILRTDIFYDIAKYKYIMSFNRLKSISKNVDEQLYIIFLDIIKKNWWLFIWEWLRWF